MESRFVSLEDPIEEEPDIERGLISLPRRIEVDVVEIHQIKAIPWNYHMFVIELHSGELKWRTNFRTSQLLRLHLTLQATALHQILLLPNFPKELISRRSYLAGIDEKHYVEIYIRNLLSSEFHLRNRRVAEFFGYGATRFSRMYGESVSEGRVKVRRVPNLSKVPTDDQYGAVGFRFTRTTMCISLEFLICSSVIAGLLFSATLVKTSEILVLLIFLSIFACILCFGCIHFVWLYCRREERWMAIKPSCIVFFSNSESTIPCEVILFNSCLRFERSKVLKHGFRWMLNGIHLSSQKAYYEIDATHEVRLIEIEQALAKAVENCEWSKLHRFNSFAPIRPSVGLRELSIVKHLVDGEQTFGEMMDALQNAKMEIFLAGWWITPDLYLKRPIQENSSSKIQNILRRVAEKGVKIYIIIYKESKYVLPNDSAYTKAQLRKLHKNISVIRHPNFVLIPQYWSHHEKIVCIDQKIAFVGGLDLCLGRYDTSNHHLDDMNYTNPTFPGKDYSNPRVKDFQEVNSPWTDLIDRERTPRMPWHDVACRLEGLAALDVSRHFIQRWNYIVSKKYTTMTNRKRITTPHEIIPFHFEFKQDSVHRRTRVIENDDSYTYSSISSMQMQISQWGPQGRGTGVCHCQILRSVCPWSIGLNIENSIQQCYIDMIKTSRNFVYIENQFFVSGFDGNTEISNRILDAIYHRILSAHEKRQQFRVMIVLPLLPAFEGAVNSKDSASLRAVMHWQYLSISRGGHSLLERLNRKVKNVADYIGFFGLRKHGVLNNTVVTEQIYVHSKVMIVDDRQCIIGSANINDRSLSGDRDSEIAVYLEDSEFLEGFLGGTQVSLGRVSHSLRLQLMSEHLRLDESQLLDPVHPHVWHEIIRHYATNNSKILETVFRCIPSNQVTSIDSLDGSCFYEDVNEIYENQRYLWGKGWSSLNLFESDRAVWTDTFGNPLDGFEHVEGDGWYPDVKHSKGDAHGWLYAYDFEKFTNDPKRKNNRYKKYAHRWVRTRRWCNESTRTSEQRKPFRDMISRMSTRSIEFNDIDSERETIDSINGSSTTEFEIGEVNDKLTVLDDVQGHLVDFPLKFLEDVDLRPRILPKSLFV